LQSGARGWTLRRKPSDDVAAILAVLALLIPAAVHAEPTTPRDLVTERAVLVMRHGIRAPLNGEVLEGRGTDRHRSAPVGLLRWTSTNPLAREWRLT
jgi:hypothetical protein